LYCRCGRRERLATPCDDWRHRGPATGSLHHHPHHAPPQFPDDDLLEPVYATISEITDSMDETGVLPAGQLLFHDLVAVFTDLAALPLVDVGDGSSRASSTASPPPVLTDTPPDRQDTVPQPVPGRAVDCPSYDHYHKHTTTTSPLRFYTYC